MLIKSLSNINQFKKRRDIAWSCNTNYWLRKNLRHIDDVGKKIINRIIYYCKQSNKKQPLIIDMGFGNAWILSSLLKKKINFSYVGLDNNKEFVDNAKLKFKNVISASFKLIDLECPQNISLSSDIVINSFNFFELCDLSVGMSNASGFLKPNGILIVSTIDKTYLLFALSDSCSQFKKNLIRFQKLDGIKFGFQKIDLGNDVSKRLEYPSVLYSTEDFVKNAKKHSFELIEYSEDVFTAKKVPKIYIHMEFKKLK